MVHAACVLGAATFAANHFETTRVADGGREVAVKKRDSCGATYSEQDSKRQRTGSCSAQPARVTASSICESVKAWSPAPPERPKKRLRTERAREKEANEAALNQHLAERTTLAWVCGAGPSAAERLEALRRRVEQRSSESAAASDAGSSKHA